MLAHFAGLRVSEVVEKIIIESGCCEYSKKVKVFMVKYKGNI